MAKKKKYTKKYTTKDLNTKIEEHVNVLAEATDEALVSSTMKDYLDNCALFHRYSPNNVMMIQAFHPGASRVAGYNAWKKFGRHVVKGGTGIPIFAPRMVKVEDPRDPNNELEECRGFMVTYVYDVSDTDGDPLPEVPDWKSPEKNEKLSRKFVEYAISQKIIVTEKPQTDGAQGRSMGGSIEIDPDAGTKTLVHEIAHELLHKMGDGKNRRDKELEAEGVAYVVCKHFGFENLSSPNYIALHGADSKLILEHLDTIKTTATIIIKAVE